MPAILVVTVTLAAIHLLDLFPPFSAPILTLRTWGRWSGWRCGNSTCCKFGGDSSKVAKNSLQIIGNWCRFLALAVAEFY